jgi:ankyrin repeat protein
VLDRLNESLDDFASEPARTASDIGAFGDYPLHKVAIWGDIDAAGILLSFGADANARGEDGDTPLHRAVVGGHAEMVRLLLKHGADPNVVNRHGSSPAKNAQESGNELLMRAMKGRL